MKKLAVVVAIMAVGCSTANTHTGDIDPRLAALEAKQRAIAGRELQCVDETRTQMESEERDRAVSECRAIADNENAEIARQERDEYEREAEQERDRTALIAILTTSRPH
jgi:hypothetical protein